MVCYLYHWLPAGRIYSRGILLCLGNEKQQAGKTREDHGEKVWGRIGRAGGESMEDGDIGKGQWTTREDRVNGELGKEEV